MLKVCRKFSKNFEHLKLLFLVFLIKVENNDEKFHWMVFKWQMKLIQRYGEHLKSEWNFVLQHVT